MHLQSFLSWHSVEPLTDADVRRRIDRVVTHLEGTARDGLTRTEALCAHLGLVVLGPRSDVLTFDLVQTDDGATAAAMHLPYGLTAFREDASISQDMRLVPLVRRVRDTPTDIMRLAPPQILVLHEQRGELFVAGDQLGFGRLYAFEHGGLSLWTNRISAALLFSGRVPPCDVEAWEGYAGIGWFPGDHTPFEGVRVLPGASRVSCRDKSDPPHVEYGDHMLKQAMAAAVQGEGPTAEQAGAALVRSFREVGRFTRQPLRVGLSGGRDSRIVAAAAIRARTDISLYTHFPPAFEREIAEQLTAWTPHVPWEALEREASRQASRPAHTLTRRSVAATFRGRHRIVDPARNAMMARALGHHHLSDGDGVPTALYTSPVMVTGLQRFIVSGAAGGFAHASYYSSTDIAAGRPPSPESLLARRLVAGFLTDVARETVRRSIAGVVDDGAEYGITGHRLFDWFHVFGRFRRWSNANWGVATFAPLLTPEFILCAFGQPIERRLSSALERELVRELIPEWADVPYGHELPQPLVVLGPSPTLTARGFFWDGPDLADFAHILARADLYEDAFDARAAQRAYRRLAATPPPMRAMLQKSAFRITSRAAFTLHRDRLVAAVDA